jgi:drug/metabolite transporter (DMT)-like permease
MKAALRSRWFYVRLALFCLNVIGFFSAIHCISRERMPLVILINYLWPTIALIASVRVVPIQITRPILFWCGCLVVVLSIAVELLYDRSNIIALIAGSATQDATAYIFALLAALSWGTYSAITRRWGDESGGPVVAPLFSAASVAVALIALPYMPQPTIHFDLMTAVCLLGGALLGVVAFWCWDLGIRKGNIVLLSLLADATPWVSLTTSHLALDVPLHDATIASAILLVTGAVLTRCGVLASKSEESTC